MNNVNLASFIAAIERLHPDGDARARLADAVVLGDRLGEVADELVSHFVTEARAAGLPWVEIGRSMGVTRQAVQKRFSDARSSGAATATARGSLPAFAQYDDEARQGILAAVELATNGGAFEVTPGHLVLALLRCPSLTVLDVDTRAVDSAFLAGGLDVAAKVDADPQVNGAAQLERPGFSEASRTSLERAHRFAAASARESITPAVLLAGALPALDVRERDALAEHGVTAERLSTLTADRGLPDEQA